MRQIKYLIGGHHTNMKTSTKILLGGLVAGGVGLVAYRRGVDKLQISIDGFGTDPGNLGTMWVRLKVVNPNRFFAYPVPRLLVNAFDSSGSFIGTILNEQLQKIPANSVSFVYGTITPNYNTLVGIIMKVIQDKQLPSGLTFHGELQGPMGLKIPFDTSQSFGGGGTQSNEPIPGKNCVPGFTGGWFCF